MSDLIRIVLLLGLAGAAVTLAGTSAAYWRDETRRMHRMLRRALGAPAQMVIIAHGRGLAAAFRMDTSQTAVMWDGGMRGLIYRLDQLVGVELIVDDRVAARAFRNEPRRPLDEIPSDAKRVLLRLVFDNPANPDFELPLWPPVDSAKIQVGQAFDAIQAARRWVSSVEAILRRTETRAPPPVRPPPVTARPAPSAQPELPWYDVDEGEDEGREP